MFEVPERNKGIKRNRRGKEDRRTFGPSIQFPIVDSNDMAVNKDRRTIPDRRIANIQVKDHCLHIRDKVVKKFKEI